MNAQERLRQAIERQENQLRADVPADREAAILALLRGQDRLPVGHAAETPDLVSGQRQANLGGSKAQQLCLEATGGGTAAPVLPGAELDLDRWAADFLQACGWLAEAELVLTHCETGFMRLADDGQGTFVAWIATKRPPPSWRERADIAWWAGWLARRHEPTLRAVGAERPVTEKTVHGDYRRLANVHLAMMAYQLGYPADAEIGGCSIKTYRDVLGRLIAWALQARESGEEAPQSEAAFVAALSSDLALAPAVIRQAVTAFTLDRENAAYHAAVPGVAAAPLVRLGPDRIVWSLYGLLTEPLFFLTRELRRRDPRAYHNSAHLREAVFRQDLYALFPEKRFATSAGRVELRRAGGDVRTDIDAVIFDRKTGTLGLFELKSQDPFARSTAELTRQRDNVLYANRQISGALDWLKRHGPDDLLSRVDARTAKAFRVQKVYPFVLGRYLVQFNDGPEPDRRAAWGTWPRVLRALDGASVANPLASLFTRLSKEEPLIRLPIEAPPREIVLGESRLTVYPSYTGVRERAAG